MWPAFDGVQRAPMHDLPEERAGTYHSCDLRMNEGGRWTGFC
ncbi:hypothetical protein LMG19144_00060 [Xanthomonas arboricola pv. fragariae]|nr:hypothetical protein LMG19144_00060 [Xanthomonas arboricola pv. fragariae]